MQGPGGIWLPGGGGSWGLTRGGRGSQHPDKQEAGRTAGPSRVGPGWEVEGGGGEQGLRFGDPGTCSAGKGRAQQGCGLARRGQTRQPGKGGAPAGRGGGFLEGRDRAEALCRGTREGSKDRGAPRGRAGLGLRGGGNREASKSWETSVGAAEQGKGTRTGGAGSPAG